MIWFTADTHFEHSRIIEYCKRPFKDHLEQDAEILARFNSVIHKGDTLYHFGDVSWSTYPLDAFFGKLNTREVHLIYGNHDKPKVTQHPNIRSYHDLKSITIENQQVILCHYALRNWLGRGHGSFQLFGHSHNTIPGLGRSMDVGVDTHDFYPWSWDEIKAKLLPIDFKVTEG